MAILSLLLLLGGNTTAQDQIIVTKVKGYPAVGDTSDTSDIVIATFTGKDFEELRLDAEAVIKLLGEGNSWVDYGPDSSYVSVAITFGDRSYIIRSWYPLFRDKDTVAVVDGHLIAVATREEKVKRENHNSDKYKALYSFLDKVTGK